MVDSDYRRIYDEAIEEGIEPIEMSDHDYDLVIWDTVGGAYTSASMAKASGGSEKEIVQLAEGLAKRGLRVLCLNAWATDRSKNASTSGCRVGGLAQRGVSDQLSNGQRVQDASHPALLVAACSERKAVISAPITRSSAPPTPAATTTTTCSTCRSSACRSGRQRGSWGLVRRSTHGPATLGWRQRSFRRCSMTITTSSRRRPR